MEHSKNCPLSCPFSSIMNLPLTIPSNSHRETHKFSSLYNSRFSFFPSPAHLHLLQLSFVSVYNLFHVLHIFTLHKRIMVHFT